MLKLLIGNPYVLIGIAAVILVSLGANVVLWSRLDANDAEITSLDQQIEIAAGDAKRWQDAANQKQGVIDEQAAEIARLAADRNAAQHQADQVAEKAAERAATLQNQISKLKEAARDHPQDVRDLGPIVRDALPSLRR